jgi:hypothetical protein
LVRAVRSARRLELPGILTLPPHRSSSFPAAQAWH